MVPITVALAVLFLFVIEGIVLIVDQLHSARSEAAYWDAKANRPPLYDWERELP